MSATIRHSALDKLDLCPCFEKKLLIKSTEYTFFIITLYK